MKKKKNKYWLGKHFVTLALVTVSSGFGQTRCFNRRLKIYSIWNYFIWSKSNHLGWNLPSSPTPAIFVLRSNRNYSTRSVSLHEWHLMEFLMVFVLLIWSRCNDASRITDAYKMNYRDDKEVIESWMSFFKCLIKLKRKINENWLIAKILWLNFQRFY